MRNGDLDGAISDCTDAIRLYPNYRDAYWLRGSYTHAERRLR